MCGIAGVYSRKQEQAVRDVLLGMAGELAHRGPDGVGLYLDRRFGMLNTRLAIVDLAGGDQPLSNEDADLWVMQNGEIYNAPELQSELEALGHRFATRCDTEVLVHAYEQWGPECLARLNGAFAFAIWDTRREELFLARDRFGIRPLFVAAPEGNLIFASEAKAILRHPAQCRQLDPRGIAETLWMWSVGPDLSAFEGIRELAPGCWMRVGPDGVIEERRWWDLEFATADECRKESEEELAEELLALLTDSARLRLRADVPVGAYLSGGLDSSATAAIVRRVSSVRLSSFAVCFSDPRFDERQHQARMARELETDLHSIEATGRQTAEAFPDVVWLGEKPLLRTAPAPLLLLSKSVREQRFKVVLTGEGADEVFAGYNIFREQKVRRFWAKYPKSETRPLLLRRLYPYLAHDMGRAEAFTRAFFSRQLEQVDDPLYSHRIRFANTARVQRFLSPALFSAAREADSEQRLLTRLPAQFEQFTALGKAQYLEITTFMQGYLLHSQGDRMLMGNGVEGRFPFLDHRVAEFAARVPDRMRVRALREKHLLRKAVSSLLPQEVVERDKQPYRAPILKAFIGPEAPEYVAEQLSPAALLRAGLFAPAQVAKLLSKCQQNLDRGISETDEMALVAVVSTMLLHEQYIENPRLAARATPIREVHGREVLRG